MAIVFPKSVFVHIPRTGGTFTRAALRHTSIHKKSFEAHPPNVSRKQGIHFPLNQIDDSILRNKFVWANVRNPISYLKSRWCSGLKSTTQIIRLKNKSQVFSAEDDFVTFTEKYLEFAPGTISLYFKKFLEKDGEYPAVDYIVKTEELPFGLIKALELAGEDISKTEKQAILSEPPRHVRASAPKNQKRTELPLELKKGIIEAEKEIIETYHYDPEELLQ